MEPIHNEMNSPSSQGKKRVNKTWEAIQKHKGLWTITYPKWVALREQLINEEKK